MPFGFQDISELHIDFQVSALILTTPYWRKGPAVISDMYNIRSYAPYSQYHGTAYPNSHKQSYTTGTKYIYVNCTTNNAALVTLFHFQTPFITSS